MATTFLYVMYNANSTQFSILLYLPCPWYIAQRSCGKQEPHYIPVIKGKTMQKIECPNVKLWLEPGTKIGCNRPTGSNGHS